jgi:ribosome biogenesis GTPase
MSETIAAAPHALGVLGWSEGFERAFVAHAGLGREPARVVAEDRGSYLVLLAGGELRATVTGRLRFEADDDPAAFPAVGDWVVVEGGTTGETVIHAVLPRRSALVRQAAGRRTEAQIVGANLDVVFVVASLNGDLNLRRLERYVATAWESGAEPVILLSKADLCADVDAALASVASVAAGAPIVVESAVDGRGIDEIRARIGPGRTAAFVGSSGVGKSTLLNRLAGDEIAATQAIREDDARGRHTTTRRELHILPGGGLVLDTPGMRELQLWDGDGLERTFADIDELASGCRFADCAHDGEPGCAIKAAIAGGTLDAERLTSWRKLRREAAHHERRVDVLARNAERQRWKQIHKSVRGHMDAKYGAEGWR